MFWIYGKQLWWHNMHEMIITECNDWTFGYDCKNNCSGHCSNNNPCIKQTGHCNGGCKSGYTNVFCDESKYYITTLYSAHLWRQISLYTCFKKNILFFIYVNTECRPGYYGNGCGNLCNGYCMNNEICSHVDGICAAGCQDGYIGKYCNNCK